MQQYDGEDWLGTEPLITDNDIHETICSDVIVVGAGLAGVAAVRQAAEMGGTVILFEKCRCIQARSGDFAVMDSNIVKRWGRQNICKEEIVNDLMRDMAYKASQDILRRWAEEAGKAFDWYLEGIPEIEILKRTDEIPQRNTGCWIQPRRLPLPEGFDNKTENYKCHQVTAWIRPSHIPVCKANFQMAVKTGNVEAFFDTRVIKLCKNEEGRVCGVVAKNREGKVYKAIASKGVILASGDYMSDPKMLNRFLPGMYNTPKQWTSYERDGTLSNTGDGHKMALWIGAKLQDSPHAPCAHHMGSVFGVSDFLLLNTRGKRFVNEDAPGQQLGSQVENLPDKTAWQIVDSSWREYIPKQYPNHGSVCYVTEDKMLDENKIFRELCFIDNYIAPKYVENAISKGELIKADTLEELLGLIGLPKEKALQSIEEYNLYCKNGYDSQFGKRADRLFSVIKAPFYAAKFTPAVMIAAMGGLQSDEEAHCYDTEGKIIPGLYLAGNVQGNRVAVDYPLTVPGLSHSLALVYGRIAAKNALNQI